MADQRVSPTAWYTAAVWAQRGLADPALARATPRSARALVRAHGLLSDLVRFPRLDDALEHRHRGIDAVVVEAIEQGGVRQVLEVPGGLASRGRRVVGRFEDVTVVEGDLPFMVTLKRRALGALDPRHHVVEVDLLSTGPRSPQAVVAALLDPAAPLAVVMEGLTYYLTDDQLVTALTALRRATPTHPSSVLVLDAFLQDQGPRIARWWAKTPMIQRVPGLRRTRAHLQTLAETAGWTCDGEHAPVPEGARARPLLQLGVFRAAV